MSELSGNSQHREIPGNEERINRLRELSRIRNKRYRERHPERNRIAWIKWMKNNPSVHRNRSREAAREKLSIPSPTRPMPLVCEICGRPGQKGRAGDRVLHLDHNHVTGKFRGWLCFGCNTGLGKLGDNIEGLRQALAYLEKAENDTFSIED